MDVNRVKMLQAMANGAVLTVCEEATEEAAARLAAKLSGLTGYAVEAKGCKVLTDAAEVIADRNRLLAEARRA